MINKVISDKREHILMAAEKLIAEHGIHGLSMQKLAKEANIAAGTIYRYFADKEELLIEVRFHVAQQIADAIQSGVLSEMPLKERFRTMWLNIWQLAGSNVATFRNRVLYESLPNANILKARTKEQKLFSKVDDFFYQGKEEGVFKHLDNEILVALSFETCVALARKHTMGCYKLNDQEVNSAIEASWDAIIKH